MKNLQKPQKKIVVSESAEFYFEFSSYCEKQVPLKNFIAWCKETVPPKSYNITLEIISDYDEYCPTNSLFVSWKRKIDNPKYEKQMKKYEKSLKKDKI